MDGNMNRSLIRASFRKDTLFVLSLLAFLALPAMYGNAAAESKSVLLQHKTADLKLLHQQIAERRQEATELLQTLDAQKEELIAEINVLAKSFHVVSYTQAKQHPRIFYNIELLRSMLAYMDAFQAKIQFFDTGQDQLTYMRQLVQDDARLTATLDDYEIDALTTQISLVVNQYLADAHVLRIDPDPKELMSASDVWAGIKSGKY